MAQGSIGGSTANSVIAARILWEAVAEEATCSSIVTARLQLRRTNFYEGQPTAGRGSFTLTIDGKTQAISGIGLTVPNDGSWVTALEATARVTHDPDGKKTLPLAAEGSLPPSSVTWVDCRGEAILDAISVGSTIESFGAEDGILDGRLLCRIVPAREGLTHRWRLLLGGECLLEGQLAPGNRELQLELDRAMLGSCYASAPEGAEVTLEWELSTFLDEGCTQPLGDPRRAAALLTIPQNEATLPTVTVACRPTGLEALFEPSAHIREIFIQNKTGLEIRVTAEGQYGAGISRVAVTLDGEPLEENGGVFSRALLTLAEVRQVEVAVTDTRGATRQLTQSITVLPYTDPQLLSAECYRCDADGAAADEGRYLWVTLRGQHSLFHGHNGDDNPCTLWLQCKPATGEDYEEAIPLFDSRGQDTQQVLLRGMATGVTLEPEQSYHARLSLQDLLGREVSTVFLIPTARVHCHEGSGFLALGKYSEGPGLDIAADWPVQIRGQLLLGEEGLCLEDYIRRIINGG